MSFLAGLYDPGDERLYEASPGRYVSNGQPPSALSAVYDYEALADTVESFETFAEGDTLSRFLPLLPLRQGFTIDSSDLRTSPLKFHDHYDLGTIGLKDETNHPSGSLWDRGAVMVLSRERERSQTTLLGTADDPSVRSTAYFLAKTDMDAYTLLEDDGEISRPVYGHGKCIRWAQSTLESIQQEVMKLCEHYDLVPALPGWNPYYGEGIKTVAYELAEQLEDPSGRIYVHTSSDYVTPYLRKGFRELRTLGWFEKTPEVVRVRFPSQDDAGPDKLEFVIPDGRTLELSRECLRECRNRWSKWGVPFGDWTHQDQVALAGVEQDNMEREHNGPNIVLSVGESDDASGSVSDIDSVRTLEGPPESLPDDFFDSRGETG